MVTIAWRSRTGCPDTHHDARGHDGVVEDHFALLAVDPRAGRPAPAALELADDPLRRPQLADPGTHERLAGLPRAGDRALGGGELLRVAALLGASPIALGAVEPRADPVVGLAVGAGELRLHREDRVDALELV